MTDEPCPTRGSRQPAPAAAPLDPRPTLDRRAVLRRLGQTAIAAMGLRILEAPRRAGASDAVHPVSAYPADVATAWFDYALTLIQHTAGFSPPVASRALGYAGVTLYEALVPGMPGYRSLAGQLNALTPLLPPNDVACHWPTVANTALAAILRSLFPTAPPADASVGSALEAAFAAQFRASVPPGRYRRSVVQGLAVAEQIFEWSRSDGGDAAYLHPFPPYTPPVGPGLWVPTGSGPALQPFWGDNRPFALAAADDCKPGAPTPYSEGAGSACHTEALEVHDAVQLIQAGLAPEHQAIALFWADGTAP